MSGPKKPCRANPKVERDCDNCHNMMCPVNSGFPYEDDDSPGVSNPCLSNPKVEKDCNHCHNMMCPVLSGFPYEDDD